MSRPLLRALAAFMLLALCTAGEFATEPWDGSLGARPRRITLEEAVNLALQQNPDILQAKQEIERTRGLVIEVRAQALPTISSAASYNQQDKNLLEGSRGGGGGGGGGGAEAGSADLAAAVAGVSGDTADPAANQALAEALEEATRAGGTGEDDVSFFFSQDKSWQVTIQARQLIYSGGQVRSALRIARFQEDSSYFSLLEQINTVIANVRVQFYQALLNRALITVQEESVELLQSELENQMNRFEAGTVPRFNVLRAEVELANVRPDLIRARNEYLISQLQLARLLGIEYGSGEGGISSPIEVVGSLTVSQRPLALDAALLAAKAQRPFLKVQRQQILIEAEQIRLSIAGYKPRITATGGYELRNSRLSDDLTDTVNGWFFGVQGSWNIFDGLETHGKIQQAKARLESSRLNYFEAVLQVELEVQTAYARIQEARELLRSQTKNVEQALEALRLARERLNAGAGTQLDVLDARVALTRARTTELRARFDYNTAMANFEAATGDATSYDAGFDDPVMRAFRKRTRDEAAR